MPRDILAIHRRSTDTVDTGHLAAFGLNGSRGRFIVVTVIITGVSQAASAQRLHAYALTLPTVIKYALSAQLVAIA